MWTWVWETAPLFLGRVMVLCMAVGVAFVVAGLVMELWGEARHDADWPGP